MNRNYHEVRTAQLRAPIARSGQEVIVDQANGIIRNVAVATVGPATGWGFSLDAQSIAMLAELASLQPDGVPCRFDHPEILRDAQSGEERMGDDLKMKLGRVSGIRIVNNQLRGDIYLGSYAKSIPGEGDVWTYVMALAADDPTAIGMSCVFAYETEVKFDDRGVAVGNVARPTSLDAVDLVSQPAANPMGLLSAKALRKYNPPKDVVGASLIKAHARGGQFLLSDFYAGSSDEKTFKQMVKGGLIAKDDRLNFWLTGAGGKYLQRIGVPLDGQDLSKMVGALGARLTAPTDGAQPPDDENFNAICLRKIAENGCVHPADMCDDGEDDEDYPAVAQHFQQMAACGLTAGPDDQGNHHWTKAGGDYLAGFNTDETDEDDAVPAAAACSAHAGWRATDDDATDSDDGHARSDMGSASLSGTGRSFDDLV